MAGESREEESKVEEDPLVISASLGEEGNVRAIMRAKNADKSAVGRAMVAAGRCGQERVMEILLKCKADVNSRESNQSLEHFVRDHDRYDMVKLFCKSGLDPHSHTAESIFERAANHGKGDGIKAVQIFLEHKLNPTSAAGYKGLQLASQSGHEAVVKHLLAAKASTTSEEGSHSLMTASLMGQFKVVKLLLDAAADATSQAGSDALNCACHIGNASLVDLLLESDADPSAGLAAAAFRNNNQFVKLLLANDADPHSRRKAIKEAARYGHEEIMRTLLRSGVEMRTVEGRTSGDAALRLTLCNTRPQGVKSEILEALEENGARRLPQHRLSLPALPGGRNDIRRPSKTWAGAVFNRTIGPWNWKANVTLSTKGPDPRTPTNRRQIMPRARSAPAFRAGR